MSSKLLINVNDATPTVVPDTDADTNAPDTGMFSVSHNDGVNTTSSMVAPIISISVLLVVLIALIVGLAKKHKSKKINNFSIYSKKHTILRITGIMTLILITTFVALNYNTKQEDNVNAASNTLTVTTSDIEIDVDLKDKAVFATGESTVTVSSATEAGYTLMAYVDSTTTDLTNETDKSSTSTISMLESTYSKALEDNTWGMAITKPTSQEDTLFRGLPTTEKEAMTIKATSDATTASDKTTIYYSTYITPDLDFGTYSGATITYIAVANVVEDDVTVNYHMPDDVEHVFPEKSGDTRYLDGYINTVTYNKSYELAYMGENCGKSYTATEPAAIVKTNNLDNNGVQHGEYSPIMDSIEVPFFGQWWVLAYQVVNVSGAAGIKIDIDYKITAPFIAVFKGAWTPDEITADGNLNILNMDAFKESQLIASGVSSESITLEGSEEYIFGGDTVTIVVAVSGGPLDGYDYGAFIKAYPIFAERQEGVTTNEEETCYSTDSSEITSEWYDAASGLGAPFSIYTYQVFVPGGNKIKMEIDYKLSQNAALLISEGVVGALSFDSWVGPSSIMLRSYDDSTITGSDEIYLNGNIVTFMFTADDSDIEGRDFEFDIKLYPVYEDEHSDTTPINMDTITRKIGVYGESVGHRYYYNEDFDPRFIDEESVKMFIDFYYDELAGQAIDLYESAIY